MQRDLVSIITPVYNAERFINETVQSIIEQKYENFELLLIDDYSTDHSLAIMNSFAEVDSRIKVLQTPFNSGAAVARNVGLENARGQYVAFVDSDDKWKKNKLKEQIEAMKKNNYNFTYTNFEIVSETNELIKEKVDLPEKLDYRALLKNTAIACSTVVIDRSVFGDFKMPVVRKGQDTATWLMLLRDGETAHLVNKVLGSYRIVKGSISSNKLQALKRTWNTYRNLEKLPLHLAIYYFISYSWNAFKRRKT